MTITEPASCVMDEPTMSWRPPKRRCQSAYEISTTPASRPSSSSSLVKTRPCRGCTPNTDAHLSETPTALTRSAGPSSSSDMLTPRIATTPSKPRFSVRIA